VTQLALYFHTLRHLRPAQLRGQLLRRLQSPARARAPRSELALRPGLAPLACLPPAPGAVSTDLRFTFLNVTAPAPAGSIDWRAPGMSRLWRYNLHYFDYLLDETLSDELKRRLLDDWIARNPPGTADAWDAYPVSLRIVNWVKYFTARARVATLPRAWLASLHAQAAWLAQNFEYHLLANHLFKNCVALFFAGGFFAGRGADAWLQRGWRSFVAQLREQFLADGGHYERSPMYHSLCLADCLDVLALAREPPIATRISVEPEIGARVLRAAGFLRDVCHPDGEIPLFNDAAFGIAPPPAQLLAHASGLLGQPGLSLTRTAERCELIDKPASGYYGFRHGADMLIIDCGPIGPDYQPGHAHCDTLSYELTLAGERLIVDSGVHDYEPGTRRTLCRTTAGHNTVAVDGYEQSEIWGTFRVARRARPVAASLEPHDAGCVFEGAHDGYRRLPGRPVHRRRMAYDGAGGIEVHDEVEGAGTHHLESRVRLHPGYMAVISKGYCAVSRPDGTAVARIEFGDGPEPQLEPGRYFPRFGVERNCAVLVWRAAGRLPLRLAYRIVKAGP